MERIGEAAALATAMCFAVSSLSFGIASRKAGGLAVNQFRVLVAMLVMLVLHVVLRGELWPSGLAGGRLYLVLASGVVGLGVGDLALFHAFGVIGPRLCSVLMAVWPAMALGLGWLVDGSGCTGRELGGVAVTTAGVALVLLRDRDGVTWNPASTPRQRWIAVGAALVGALGQAGGYLLARAAMVPGADLPEGLPPVAAAVVRMCAGAVAIVLFGLLGRRAIACTAVVSQRVVLHTLFGTLLGPVAGIWLSLIAARHAPVSAAALIVTTPLFLLPITWLVYRTRVGAAGVLGTVLTVVGAFVLMWRPGAG